MHDDSSRRALRQLNAWLHLVHSRCWLSKVPICKFSLYVLEYPFWQRNVLEVSSVKPAYLQHEAEKHMFLMLGYYGPRPDGEVPTKFEAVI